MLLCRTVWLKFLVNKKKNDLPAVSRASAACVAYLICGYLEERFEVVRSLPQHASVYEA